MAGRVMVKYGEILRTYFKTEGNFLFYLCLFRFGIFFLDFWFPASLSVFLLFPASLLLTFPCGPASLAFLRFCVFPLFCFFASLLFRFFASLLPWLSSFLLFCFFASLLLFSAFPCFSALSASLLFCLSALSCSSAYLFLCFLAFLLFLINPKNDHMMRKP